MILVTGASGFVGQAVCAALTKNFNVRAVVRGQPVGGLLTNADVVYGKLSADFDWSSKLVNVDIVVHCAARVHVMYDDASDPLAEFRRINVEGTLQLAKHAAQAGVRRFIFLSSIKVNGEQTEFGRPFTADQKLHPMDPYGISKMEAEERLRSIANETGMEVVIIRPPLVYGPGVKANFLAMMRWLSRGIPLPFGALTGNKRSLVALDNLVDLIVTCIDHPNAANQCFLVSDCEDMSTADLLLRMGRVLGHPARLIPVPVALLQFGAKLVGRSGVAQRLCSSLEVDIGKTQKLLNWSPPIGVDEGLRLTVANFRKFQDTPHG